MARKLTTESFIERSQALHSDKYDYSRVVIDNGNRTNVTIICSEHGEFVQRAGQHLEGRGCKGCSDSLRKKDISTFIRDSKEKHGDKYDYSKVKYVNAQSKVVIVCPNHGDFEQIASAHMQGKGCRKCYTDSNRKINDDFIEEASKIHSFKYDYSKTIYITRYDKVIITCKEHGNFEQAAYTHLKGSGCPKCALKNNKSSREEFIAKANEIHNSYYSYSKLVYTGSNDKVLITCPKHGDFEQLVNNHLSYKGCPKCSHSIKSLSQVIRGEGRDTEHNLYLARQFNDEEDFWNIGIAKSGFERRYGKENVYEATSQKNILKAKTFIAYLIEQTLLTETEEFHYVPKNACKGIKREARSIDGINTIISKMAEIYFDLETHLVDNNVEHFKRTKDYTPERLETLRKEVRDYQGKIHLFYKGADDIGEEEYLG